MGDYNKRFCGTRLPPCTHIFYRTLKTATLAWRANSGNFLTTKQIHDFYGIWRIIFNEFGGNSCLKLKNRRAGGSPARPM